MIADQIIRNNPNEIILAGGMENMSQSPHYLLNSRVGNRLGNGKATPEDIAILASAILLFKHKNYYHRDCLEVITIVVINLAGVYMARLI